jgi:hypothetical protein
MTRVISILLARVALVLALLAPSGLADASSSINICNVGNTSLFVVMVGRAPGGGAAIDGWQDVEIGACRSVTMYLRSVLGFAVVGASGRKGMQVYDPALFLNPAVTATEWKYCVDPAKNFHREQKAFKGCICEAGQAQARFAFHVRPKDGETLTLRIPADKNGEIIPFERPTPLTPALPPFQQGAWLPTPDASFMIAMHGLAEQQERLGFRIEQSKLSPTTTWHAYYLRELGVVVRPETRAASVGRGSPAEKAGIRRGDEIAQFNGIELKSAWHARSLLARTRPGEMHTIVFLRGGQLHEAKIRLEALPANLAATDLHPEQGWLGIEFESAARVAGVIYRDGVPHLELDDDVQKIGRTDFDGVEGLAEWLARDHDAATVELEVWRRSAGKIMVMTLDKLE